MQNNTQLTYHERIADITTGSSIRVYQAEDYVECTATPTGRCPTRAAELVRDAAPGRGRAAPAVGPAPRARRPRQQPREASRVAAPRADLEHRPDQHPHHVPHEGVGLDPELEQRPRRGATRPGARRARSARARSASGVNAVKSCVPGQRARAHARSAGSSSGCGHHSARSRSNGLGAGARQHAVAVGPRPSIAPRVEAVRRRARPPTTATSCGRTPFRDRSSAAGSGSSSDEKLDHLPPRVHAGIGAPGDGQRQARSRAGSRAHPSTPLDGPQPRLSSPPQNPPPWYSR